MADLPECVLVTRPGPAGERISVALRALGCDVILAPAIEVILADAAAAAKMRDRADACQALLITSPRALEGLRRGVEAWGGPPAWAVGERSARGVRELGHELIGTGSAGLAALIERILAADHPPKSLFWPRGNLADPDSVAPLKAAGIRVDDAIAYRTQGRYRAGGAPSSELLSKVDAAIVGSPSAVDELDYALSDSKGLRRSEPALAAIGESTAAAARARGFARVSVAELPGNEGLMKALRELGDCR